MRIIGGKNRGTKLYTLEGIETRPGMTLLGDFGSQIFGLFFYDIDNVRHTIVHCGTKLYDNIWLSNVGQYLKNHELYDIVYKLSKILDIDGQILVCYLYHKPP